MALAMLSVVGSYAYEPVVPESEYIYTATGRVKVMGENLLTNGDFSDGFTGWVSGQSDPTVNQTVWKLTDGAGPAGETVAESLGATADEGLCMKFADLEGGASYVVSFQINVPEALTTTVGTTIGNNYANIFLNTDGSFSQVAGTEEAPVTGVATAVNVTAAGEWTTVAYDFTPEEGQILVIHFEKMLTGVQIANVSLKKVTKVSDDRVMLRLVDWAEKILADDNFKSDDPDAVEAKQTILEDIAGYYVPELYDEGELEAIDAIGTALEALNNDLADYMDYTSFNQKDQLKNIDITSIGSYGRGRFSSAGALVLEGGSWSHGSGEDYLLNAIQKGYDLTGTFKVQNADFPAGKYFISMEIRNANTGKNRTDFTYNLETTCKLFVGSTEQEVTIKGEDYQRFYLIGDINEAGAFNAGVYWPGPGGSKLGGAFWVKNVEVRAFDNIGEQILRKQSWDKFKAQWDAAVGARNALIEAQSDINLPWEKDSLQRALTNWDPYYNAVLESGWMTAEGEDAGKASNEELEAWAKYNGVEMYKTEETEEGPVEKRLEYQLVRNYQWARSYVVAQNKVFADLKAEIANAESIRDDDMNALGDKTTFNIAITAAQNLYDTKIETTSNTTMKADSLELATGIETLKAAEEVFKASVPELVPIVSIDFSNPFEKVEEVLAEGEEPTLMGYVIQGAAGKMEFLANGVDLENPDSHTYGLGFDGENLEVLHVGSTEATVNLPQADQPTADDILRVQFDLWLGNLGGGFMTVELRNEDGERVAGFSIDRYNANVAYNDFNDVIGTVNGGEGMDLRQYSTGMGSSQVGNNGICVDANRTQFDLIIDYKAQSIKGTILNGKGQTCDGRPFAFGDVVQMQSLTDTKITKFVITSSYQKANSGAQARRCWFDNLVMLKYPSQASGPIPTGIETVAAPVQKADNAIYTLTGVKVSASKNSLQPGLYIINGKKYVVK